MTSLSASMGRLELPVRMQHPQTWMVILEDARKRNPIARSRLHWLFRGNTEGATRWMGPRQVGWRVEEEGG